MSLTISHIGSTIYGNHRMIAVRLTPSTTAQEVWTTGLNNIYGASICLHSHVSGGIRVGMNELSAGTASPGSLAIISHSAGDEIQVCVFGA